MTSDYLPGIPAVLAVDPGITTGWAVVDRETLAILGTGVADPDKVGQIIDTVVRGMHRAGYALDVVVEGMPRAGRAGRLGGRLEEVRHVLTTVLEETFERPITYVTPGEWKPSRVARTAELPREFGGKRLSAHQRDAIRMALYVIDKEAQA